MSNPGVFKKPYRALMCALTGERLNPETAVFLLENGRIYNHKILNNHLEYDKTSMLDPDHMISDRGKKILKRVGQLNDIFTTPVARYSLKMPALRCMLDEGDHSWPIKDPVIDSSGTIYSEYSFFTQNNLNGNSPRHLGSPINRAPCTLERIVPCRTFELFMDELAVKTPLQRMILDEDVHAVERLLTQSNNSSELVNIANERGRSPLLLAICHNKTTRIIELLIQAQANVHCGGEGFNSPLITAARYRRLNVINLLINAGANRQLRNKFGFCFQDIIEMMKDNEIADRGHRVTI